MRDTTNKIYLGSSKFSGLVLFSLLINLLLMPPANAQTGPAKSDRKNILESSETAVPSATIPVTTTADVIDAAVSCPAVTIGLLPGPDGLTSLREAICAANSNPVLDTVSFSVNGTFAISGAVNEDNGDSGDFDIKQGTLFISGNGAANTIIDGSGIERIFDVFPTASSASLVLSNLTLQNGDTRSTLFKEGGAIYLHNNVSSSFSNIQIINNFAGANGAIENRGTCVIFNSTISGNQTIPATGSVTGGGIHSSGSLTISNTTISNNSVRGEGGGIATSTAASTFVSIQNSLISNNVASVTGGGNGNGGAISTTGTQGGLDVRNTTISGNRADNNGGGAYLTTPGGGTGTASFSSTTITNNIADNDNNGAGDGGGLAQITAAVTLQNTIAAGNINSTAATRDDVRGSLVGSSSFSLIGDDTGMSGLTNGVNANQIGSGGSPIDAQLMPLANNGGPTLTHDLAFSSPAFDKGNGLGSTDDQRGSLRPRDHWLVAPAPGGDNCDIGAFEKAIPTAAAVSISGRVLTADGRGIGNVAVYLAHPDGSVAMAQTGNLGYYLFNDVRSGGVYTISIASKRHWFENPVRVVTANDPLSDVDFVAGTF